MTILRTDVIAHSQLTSANASVAFDGGDGANGSTGLRTADGDAGYELGNSTESITIECWIYPTSVSQTFDVIFSTNNYGVSGNSLILYNNNDGFYMSATGFVNSDLAVYGLLEVNTWYHVAFVKENHQVRLYLDGEIIGYRETTSDFSEDQLCIGASNYGGGFPTYSFAGNISNFRVVKRALYKENFTPSKFKLKNIPGTTLLCCQDSSDDTTAAVGSISAGGSPTPGGLGPDLKEDITDTGVVFEDNTKFDSKSYMVPPGGTTTESNRGRAVYAGGYKTPSAVTNIDYLSIQSGGFTETFGNLSSTALGNNAACSSETRMIAGGGWTGSANNNAIEYITIATTSNSTDFGDLAVGRRNFNAASNGTRGLFYGGNGTPADSTQVDYVTVATTGNAADFGDASQVMLASPFATASNTRALFGGGYAPGGSVVNTIEYFTIASTGNYTNFGDLTSARQSTSGLNSSTRSVFGGGGYPTAVNTIDYVTTATTGNASDFGDLSQARGLAGGTSNGTRGVFMGGTSNPARLMTIDSITIASKGVDAANWGDFRLERQNGGAASDSHGGLS